MIWWEGTLFAQCKHQSKNNSTQEATQIHSQSYIYSKNNTVKILKNPSINSWVQWSKSKEAPSKMLLKCVLTEESVDFEMSTHFCFDNFLPSLKWFFVQNFRSLMRDRSMARCSASFIFDNFALSLLNKKAKKDDAQLKKSSKGPTYISYRVPYLSSNVLSIRLL